MAEGGGERWTFETDGEWPAAGEVTAKDRQRRRSGDDGKSKVGVAGNFAWRTIWRDFVEVLAAHGAVTGGKAP